MEKSTRLEIKVGLFVFFGLVLLAVLIIQFSKGASLFRNTYALRLHATDVGGLKEHASVLLAGVTVGSVKNIELAQDSKSVTITLQVYQDYKIYSDARFVIESAGFLGDQYVAVIPMANKEPALTNNAEVNCQEPFNLQEVARSTQSVMKQINDTAKKLDSSVAALHDQVLNEQTLASFGESITNLRNFTQQALATMGDIKQVIATNSGQISITMSNAASFSAELTQLGASAQAVLATNSVNVNLATKNIADASATLKHVADDIQAGKGLAGVVLQNPALATNVQVLAANLAVTSSNLNRLGLWGILWSHKTPETNVSTTVHSGTKH